MPVVSNVHDLASAVLLSEHIYANDVAGRRVSRNGDTFVYNARSEVISAVIGTNDYGYAYDAIGNRVWSAVNTLTNTYTANRLNQYTAVTPPIAVAYDADGNMTYLGEWHHTWDAENRLTSSQPAGFATNGAIRLEYVYNHKNLRVAKIKKQLSGRGADYPFNPLQPGTWDAIETRRYVWDGYNIAAEIVIDEVTPSTNVTYYTWGLDLSGTLQGAGGVGGLLAVVRSDGTFFPCYDANGNITEYVDGSGNIRAHYKYSPFGETIVQSGDLADTFTHRFSTKPFDAETGLVMYQLRPYAPGLGRWMSRDPIGERGGRNLYGFVENNVINRWDGIGLKATSPFEFVGAEPIIQDDGVYLGLWFGANDYLDRHPAYALFVVSLSVDVSECKKNGKSQSFNDSNNFFASRADGDVMISSKEIYLNPLNSRGVRKNSNGTIGGWKDFIPNKENGQFCTKGSIKISIKWYAMTTNPFRNWKPQQENYDPWWHDQTHLPNSPTLPSGFNPNENAFANGTQSIIIVWQCKGTEIQETTSPEIDSGYDRAKNR